MTDATRRRRTCLVEETEPAALLLLVFLWPLSAGDGVFGATIIDHNVVVVVSATQ